MLPTRPTIRDANHRKWVQALVASSRFGRTRSRRSAAEHNAAMDRLITDLRLDETEMVIRETKSPGVVARLEQV
jgi:hypothetical protein